MNELLYHLIPLIAMIINSLSSHWVYWSGKLIIEDIFSFDLEMYWGVYKVDIESSLLGKSYISMGIPDFIEFTSNKLGLNIIKKTTLPLYYSVYLLYILCIIYQCYHLTIGLCHYNLKLDYHMVKKYYLVELSVLRTIISIFLIWSLFSYYSTSGLCLNKYIEPFNVSEPFNYVVSLDKDSICSYSWNTITILLNEFILFIFGIYIYNIGCVKKRYRSGSDLRNSQELSRSNTSISNLTTLFRPNSYTQLRQDNP